MASHVPSFISQNLVGHFEWYRLLSENVFEIFIQKAFDFEVSIVPAAGLAGTLVGTVVTEMRVMWSTSQELCT